MSILIKCPNIDIKVTGSTASQDGNVSASINASVSGDLSIDGNISANINASVSGSVA